MGYFVWSFWSRFNGGGRLVDRVYGWFLIVGSEKGRNI